MLTARKILIFISFALVLCFLFSCQSTPEEKAVIAKSEDAVYYSAGRGAIDVPEKWVEQAVSGKLSISADTEIDVPDMDKYPVVKIEPAVFSQSQIDELIDYFAPGCGLFKLPAQMSRVDYEKEFLEIKHRQEQSNYYSDEEYDIHFYNYGIDAVLGDSEPQKELPHEVGLLFEVIAKTQRQADTVCASLRSTLLHFGSEGRKSTAGNLAFPFAPSDVSFGPVYAFSVYHLMEIGPGEVTDLFPIEAISWGREAL